MKTQADYMRELDEIKAFNGWNDRELGALLGTSGALVSNWRTGKTQMTNKSKRRILDFLRKWQYAVNCHRPNCRPARTI